MYCHHFGFERVPFSITPDTSFVYSSTSQCNALNVLLMATDAGEGFIKITGEVGSGKTLLCRRFLARLAAANEPRRRFRTAYVPNPCLRPLTLLMTIASEFKLRVPNPDSESSLLNSINRALLRYAARGEQVVVCLDEAQSMPVETLESLRLLSNMETEQRKLIQVVLVGQRELDAKLAHDNLRQLRSRISFSYRLGSLSLAETGAYLEHRAKVAGYSKGTPLFSDKAIRSIYSGAHGLPRRINILAHKALLATYGQGADRVELAHVNAARADAVTPGIRAMFHDWLTRILSALHLRRINLPVRANQGISP